VLLSFCVAEQQVPECKGNAYAVLATNQDHWCAAHVLALSLLRSGTRHHIVIMHEGISSLANTGSYPLTAHPHVRYNEVNPARARGRANGAWESTYSKFWAGRMVQYCRVILLDADMVVLRNIDHLFAAVDGTNLFAAPSAYWISQQFLCSCLIVMKPTAMLFADVLENANGASGEDMDYFNRRHGARTKRLDAEYNALIGEWYPKDGIYHRLQRNVSVVHFIAGWKPFKFADWSVNLDKIGMSIYATWWEDARSLKSLDEHCPKWESVYSRFQDHAQKRGDGAAERTPAA
jgi:hypothetical protein